MDSIDFRAQLNDQQYSAVTSSARSILVLAGAGSGKTRVLTYRVAYLLSQGVPAWQILLLTFTNKAAKEMLQRVSVLTDELSLSELWGGTFHSVGLRVLRRHGETVGLKSGFIVIDEKEAETFLTEVIESKNKPFLADKMAPKPRLIANIISYARNTCSSLADTIVKKYSGYEEYLQEFMRFQQAYQALKLERQAVDYDDLLEAWLHVLERDPSAAQYYQRRFQHILVDEYQDTNALQAKIIDLMSGNHQIMAVGDDAQCIYTWRGASYENIMTFPDRHPDTVIYKIELNYRSTAPILRLANAILEQQCLQNQGYCKELRSVRKEKLIAPQVISVFDTESQAYYVVKKMRELLTKGYAYKDMAVLYRAHYQAMDLQLELSRSRITYTITSGVRFFEQAHIRDLVALLRFAVNPRDIVAFRRIVLLLPRIGIRTADRLFSAALEEGKGSSVIQVLCQEKILGKVPQVARDTWLEIGSLWKEMEKLQTTAPGELLSMALNGWYGNYLARIYDNYAARRDDLDTMVDFAFRFEDTTEFLAQVVLLNSEVSDRSPEEQNNTVRLTTVHQAKGLEFPVVFIIGLAEGLFPLKRALEEGTLEEERRLFYVGVTRAKDELYLYCPRSIERHWDVIDLELCSFLEKTNPDCYEFSKK